MRSERRTRTSSSILSTGFGHPFLDGNGRTIMVVHAELAERTGFSVEWTATSKTAYLDALTQEIAQPRDRHLDVYLKGPVGG